MHIVFPQIVRTEDQPSSQSPGLKLSQKTRHFQKMHPIFPQIERTEDQLSKARDSLAALAQTQKMDKFNLCTVPLISVGQSWRPQDQLDKEICLTFVFVCNS